MGYGPPVVSDKSVCASAPPPMSAGMSSFISSVGSKQVYAKKDILNVYQWSFVAIVATGLSGASSC